MIFYTSAFLLVMFLIALIDWQQLIIPNNIIVVGLISGLLLNIMLGTTYVVYNVVSSFVAFGITALVRIGGSWLFKKPIMGMGDVKLAALVGLFLGFQGFLVALWLAAIIGTLYGMIRRKRCQSSQGEKLPFGSFIAVTSSVVMLFAESLHHYVDVWLTLIR